MFSKLLKHTWKANSGLLGILSLCVLGVGLLGAGVLRTILFLEYESNNENAWMAIGSLSSIMGFLALALVVYALAVQFINLFHFYKSRFTDEGYLTFTLPMTARQIFLSSFVNSLLWMIISALVVIAAVCIAAFLGGWEYIQEYFRELGNVIDFSEELIFDDPGYKAYMLLSTISTLFSPVYSLMLIMTSITIGCVLAKKHKILAAIGIFYCIQAVVGILESVLAVVPGIMILEYEDEQYYSAMVVSVIITLVVQAGLTIGGYFLSTSLMKNKLNLP